MTSSINNSSFYCHVCTTGQVLTLSEVPAVTKVLAKSCTVSGEATKWLQTRAHVLSVQFKVQLEMFHLSRVFDVSTRQKNFF